MDNTQIKRIGAFILDMFFVGIFTTLIESLFYLIFESQNFEFNEFNITIRFGSSILFYLCYFMFFDIFNKGNSIGKLIFGVKVIFKNNKELNKYNNFIRTLIKLFSVLILPISILLYLFMNYYTFQDNFSRTKTINK